MRWTSRSTGPQEDPCPHRTRTFSIPSLGPASRPSGRGAGGGGRGAGGGGGGRGAGGGVTGCSGPGSRWGGPGPSAR
ncbi:hypothetical protein F7Q99_02590 [Streptomyces kaniharaensis]|uniref:Uncharacterized protein n=1 Tax=Streptomyces kaniharaensis TaxID=212423 RepID=A0A6N7KI80_9ACTN|nr:hypothetical protein [Streptomyces kaniharaensis]